MRKLPLTLCLWTMLLGLGTISLGGCNFNKFINYPPEVEKPRRNRRPLPPVTSANKEFSHQKMLYTVQRDDTIDSIAWAFEKNPRELLRLNQLSENQLLTPGQKILLQNPGPTNQIAAPSSSLTEPATKVYKTAESLTKEFRHSSAQESSKSRAPKPRATLLDSALNQSAASFASTKNIKQVNWQMPTKGKVTKLPNSRGIEILGEYNQAVYAASSGIVVYSGNGINYFDNLVIIKHQNQLISAYGYNAKNLVKVGQKVQAGQKIALMGYHYNRPSTYFELRQAGHAVNPFNYIKMPPSN